MVNIYNSLNKMKELEKWEAIENVMNQLEQMDNEIDGHTINIRIKEHGNKFSLININQNEL